MQERLEQITRISGDDDEEKREREVMRAHA
jgi:hypothetical protein